MPAQRTTNTGRPQPVDGASADGARTAELGSEGGSYGELGQPGKPVRENGDADRPQGRGRSVVGVGLLLSGLAVAVYLSVTVGACWRT